MKFLLLLAKMSWNTSKYLKNLFLKKCLRTQVLGNWFFKKGLEWTYNVFYLCLHVPRDMAVGNNFGFPGPIFYARAHCHTSRIPHAAWWRSGWTSGGCWAKTSCGSQVVLAPDGSHECLKPHPNSSTKTPSQLPTPKPWGMNFAAKIIKYARINIKNASISANSHPN